MVKPLKSSSRANLSMLELYYIIFQLTVNLVCSLAGDSKTRGWFCRFLPILANLQSRIWESTRRILAG